MGVIGITIDRNPQELLKIARGDVKMPKTFVK